MIRSSRWKIDKLGERLSGSGWQWGDGPKAGGEPFEIATELTKAIVRQMAEAEEIETTGQTRGVRYWSVGASR